MLHRAAQSFSPTRAIPAETPIDQKLPKVVAGISLDKTEITNNSLANYLHNMSNHQI